jgi:hypothetical protein
VCPVNFFVFQMLARLLWRSCPGRYLEEGNRLGGETSPRKVGVGVGRQISNGCCREEKSHQLKVSAA